MAHRIQRLASQLAGSAHDEDVVIVAAVRTPLCRAKRGGLASMTPDLLLKEVLKEVVIRSKLPLSAIQDICVGNVLQPGGGAMMARMAQFLAELPPEIPLSTVNRQCSSGLQALANIAGAIKAGVIDGGIAGGVESMSHNAMTDATPVIDLDAVGDVPLARDCMLPMLATSENVAERFGVSREAQDAFAARSQRRAAAAQSAGAFDREIIPVTNKEGVLITKDDGVRPTTVESLAKLRPAFKEGGSTTAGNSSQVTDGAAAVVAVRRSVARSAGVPVLGVLRAYAVVGCPPDIMGIGPALAIPAAVKQAGLVLDDIDVFEINEAFASQAVYCVRELGLEAELGSDRVNPLGGAIALGHPLGCTGARQVATLLHYLQATGKRYGVVSMCIGTGMGAAAVFENEAGKHRLAK